MRRYFWILFGFLAPFLGEAQCISGKCDTGIGIMRYPSSGAHYVGQFEGNKREGFGNCYFPNDGNYSGYWKSDKPNGEGIRMYGDGRIEKGIWKDGKLQKSFPNLVINLDGETKRLQPGCFHGNCGLGTGVYVYPDGSIYNGDFKNNRRNGYGTMYYTNKSIYVGTWANDNKHGMGNVVNPDGSKISGVWQDNERVEAGNQATVPGAKAANKTTGCISGDCTNGYGTFKYENGAQYRGPFQHGLPKGQGELTGVTGTNKPFRYVGAFDKGQPNGQGTCYMLNEGTKQEGFWKDGELVQPLDLAAQSPTSRQENSNNPKIWSVIIGVAAYRDMPVLRFTDDDAYRIYAFLKSPEGGAVQDEQIRILIDEGATRSNIMSAMREVFDKAGPNDFVLLYFSGHGLPGAFLPIDFNGNDNKVFHYEINEMLKRSKARYKLCIADACHSGGMLAARSVESNISTFYQQLAQAQPGTALIMSSKSEETSLEASGLRQGVFSHFLIRGLKGEADRNRDTKVTIEELFNFVYDNVRKFTGNMQSPIIRGDHDPNMIVSFIGK
jgi:hypothetical protein